MSPDIILLLIAAFAGLLAGRLQLPAARPRLPRLTLGVLLLLAIALAAQTMAPQLLPRFQRDAGAIAQGEFYRLFTALWFQDGGLAGGASNLAMLFVTGGLAERLLGPRAWLLVYFGAGLAAECVALSWQPIGAGNSIAWLGLAGGMLAPVRTTAARPLVLRTVQIVGLCAGVALAIDYDIHGLGLLCGAALGLILDRLRRSGGAISPAAIP